MMREAAPQPATSSVSQTGLGGMGRSTLQQTNLSEQLVVGRKSRVITDFHIFSLFRGTGGCAACAHTGDMSALVSA